MPIATKQSLSYGVPSYQEIASATRSFTKNQVPHVPRNDAAVVRFTLGRIAAIVGVYDAAKLKFQEPSINKF